MQTNQTAKSGATGEKSGHPEKEKSQVPDSQIDVAPSNSSVGTEAKYQKDPDIVSISPESRMNWPHISKVSV